MNNIENNNTLNIVDFDYDLENGFAWILIEGDSKKIPLTVQCCLEEASKRIDTSDCGHDWGCCGDTNYEAFNKYGEDSCMDALFHRAEEDGFIIE